MKGFRYRDIETGVWLSRDPAGFVDGPNLYAYVYARMMEAGLWI
jgi:RHS repeat-associated protein